MKRVKGKPIISFISLFIILFVLICLFVSATKSEEKVGTDGIEEEKGKNPKGKPHEDDTGGMKGVSPEMKTPIKVHTLKNRGRNKNGSKGKIDKKVKTKNVSKQQKGELIENKKIEDQTTLLKNETTSSSSVDVVVVNETMSNSSSDVVQQPQANTTNKPTSITINVNISTVSEQVQSNNSTNNNNTNNNNTTTNSLSNDFINTNNNTNGFNNNSNNSNNNNSNNSNNNNNNRSGSFTNQLLPNGSDILPNSSITDDDIIDNSTTTGMNNISMINSNVNESSVTVITDEQVIDSDNNSTMNGNTTNDLADGDFTWNNLTLSSSPTRNNTTELEENSSPTSVNSSTNFSISGNNRTLANSLSLSSSPSMYEKDSSDHQSKNAGVELKHSQKKAKKLKKPKKWEKTKKFKKPKKVEKSESFKKSSPEHKRKLEDVKKQKEIGDKKKKHQEKEKKKDEKKGKAEKHNKEDDDDEWKIDKEMARDSSDSYNTRPKYGEDGSLKSDSSAREEPKNISSDSNTGSPTNPANSNASDTSVTPSGPYSFQSYNFPTFSFGIKGHKNNLHLLSDDPPYYFNLVSPGLSGAINSVSFQSVTRPNSYLRHSNYFIKLDPYVDNELYKKDATFLSRPNRFYVGYNAYESVNYPKHFIRHANYRLKIATNDGSDLMHKDASFRPKVKSSSTSPSTSVVPNNQTANHTTGNTTQETGNGSTPRLNNQTVIPQNNNFINNTSSVEGNTESKDQPQRSNSTSNFTTTSSNNNTLNISSSYYQPGNNSGVTSDNPTRRNNSTSNSTITSNNEPGNNASLSSGIGANSPLNSSNPTTNSTTNSNNASSHGSSSYSSGNTTGKTNLPASVLNTTSNLPASPNIFHGKSSFQPGNTAGKTNLPASVLNTTTNFTPNISHGNSSFQPGNSTTGNRTIGNGISGIDTTRNDTTRNGTTRIGTTRNTIGNGISEIATTGIDTTRNDTTRNATTRNDTTRNNTTRNDTTRNSTTRNNTTRIGTTRNSTIGNGISEIGTTGIDTTKNNTTRIGTTRNATTRNDTTRNDTTRIGTTKNDTTGSSTTGSINPSLIRNNSPSSNLTSNPNNNNNSTKSSQNQNSGDSANVSNQGEMNKTSNRTNPDKADIKSNVTNPDKATKEQNGISTAGENGRSTSIPKLMNKACSPPPLVPNGNHSPIKSSYEPLERITLSCTTGYKPSTDELRRICTHGVFVPSLTDKPVHCYKYKDCTSVPSVKNGKFKPNKSVYKHNETIKLHCNNGYKSSQSTQFSCFDGIFKPQLSSANCTTGVYDHPFTIQLDKKALTNITKVEEEVTKAFQYKVGSVVNATIDTSHYVSSQSTSSVKLHIYTTKISVTYGQLIESYYIYTTNHKIEHIQEYPKPKECPASTIEGYNFVSSLPEKESYSRQTCSQGFPMAMITCAWKWRQINEELFRKKIYFDLDSFHELECSSSVDSLTKELKNPSNMSGEMMDLISAKLAAYTSSPKFPLNNIESTASALQELAMAGKHVPVSKSCMTSTVTIVSHITDALNQDGGNSEELREAKSIAVECLSDIAVSVKLEDDEQHVNIDSNNIKLRVQKPDGKSSQASYSPFVTNEQQTTAFKPVQITMNYDPKSSINSRAVFLYHKNDNLFSRRGIEVISSEMKDGNTRMKRMANINTNVSVSITHLNQVHEYGVEKHLGQLKATYHTERCVYWDFATSDWSNYGCCLDGKTSPAVCKCNHTTNFALIVATETVPNDLALSMFGDIGLISSILGITATIFIHLNDPKLRRKQSTKIQMNLCFNYLIGYLIFLIGVMRTENVLICHIITASMHYVFLVAWFWLAVYGNKLYRSLVKVFASEVKNYLKKAVLFAYLTPLVIVGIDVGVTLGIVDQNIQPSHFCDGEKVKNDASIFRSHYRASHMCWLHEYSLYFGFLLWVGIIVLHNTFVFYNIIKNTIMKRGRLQSTRRLKKRENQAMSLILTFSLGLGWSIGFVMMFSTDHLYNIILSWIFTLLNGFQGLFIFYVFCWRPKNVRRSWWRPLQRGLSRISGKSFATSMEYSESSITVNNPSVVFKRVNGGTTTTESEKEINPARQRQIKRVQRHQFKM